MCSCLERGGLELDSVAYVSRDAEEASIVRALCSGSAAWLSALDGMGGIGEKRKHGRRLVFLTNDTVAGVRACNTVLGAHVLLVFAAAAAPRGAKPALAPLTLPELEAKR